MEVEKVKQVKEKTEKNRAKEQAQAQIKSICSMMKALEEAEEKGKVTFEGDEYDEEGMREMIEQNALEVSVRSGWYRPGTEPEKPDEFKILLCTGGPAVRITGDLDGYGQPESATVEYQDWFTYWEKYLDTTPEQEELILRYCHHYYFG